MSLTLTGSGTIGFSRPPAFSNVSAAAVSSAVGIYSLKPVKTTIAKVCSISLVPGVSGTFPPSGLPSGGPTIIKGVTYTPSASSEINPSYFAFDYNTNTFWQTSPANGYYYTYYARRFTYAGYSGSASLGGYAGEYIILSLSVPINITSYTITGIPSYYYGDGYGNYVFSPYSWYILGSNDNISWTQVHSVSGASIVGTPTTFTPPPSTNTWKYVAMVITSAYGYNLQYNNLVPVFIGISEIVFNSTVTSTTDVYAHRNGELLTAPVTGRSIQDFLGGQTAYIQTWYDQSGNGNHATSGTAILDVTNKYVDLKPTSFFTLPSTPLVSGTNNYTIIAHHNTTTSPSTILALGSGGVDAQNWLSVQGTYYVNEWGGDNMISAASSYAPGNVVTVKYDNTVGRTMYINGTSVVTNGARVLNCTGTQNYIGYGSSTYPYLNGELYTVFVFNSALSDADRLYIESL